MKWYLDPAKGKWHASIKTMILDGDLADGEKFECGVVKDNTMVDSTPQIMSGSTEQTQACTGCVSRSVSAGFLDPTEWSGF